MKRLILIGLGLLIVTSSWAASNKPSFPVFVKQLKQEMVKEGFSKSLLDKAFKNVKYINRVVYKSTHQPSQRMTLDRYMKLKLTPGTISYGRFYMRRHHDLLEKIGKKYQVQPAYIVALLGEESSYGRVTGKYPEISALVTLIYKHNRSRYFTKELVYALKILKNHEATFSQLKGSWAGAMGQTQFMPTHYYDYAVDYSHNGHKNIWTDTPDVLASIAYSLHRYHWIYKAPVAVQVTLPKDFDKNLIGLHHEHTVAFWLKKGVKPATDLSAHKSLKMSLTAIDAKHVYLVSRNYRVLLDWNHARFYVLSIVRLAHMLGAKP